jgi:hypothetical protein
MYAIAPGSLPTMKPDTTVTRRQWIEATRRPALVTFPGHLFTA